jgi:hypothetical protein
MPVCCIKIEKIETGADGIAEYALFNGSPRQQEIKIIDSTSIVGLGRPVLIRSGYTLS